MKMTLVWVILSATACARQCAVDFQSAPFVGSGPQIREAFRTFGTPQLPVLLFVEILACHCRRCGQIGEPHQRDSATWTASTWFQQPWHILPLPRVDFGRRVGIIRASCNLDDIQLLATVTDNDRPRSMAAVNQARQCGVQFVHSRLVHNVNVHAGRFSVTEDREAVKIFSGGWTAGPTIALSRRTLFTTTNNRALAPDGPSLAMQGLSKFSQLRRPDSNRRPTGYEPAELPLLHAAFEVVLRRPEWVKTFPAHWHSEPAGQHDGGLS
jgi:hypothetical protein